MREFSPEIAAQIREQLDRATAARPAHAYGTEPAASKIGSAKEAVIEAMFLLAAADGTVTPLEIAQFADGLDSLLGSDAHGNIDAVVSGLAEKLAREGWDRRLAAVKEGLVGTDLAETALRLAAAVAFVDDTIEHAEAAALDALASALSIPSDREHAILKQVRDDLFGP